MADGRPDAAARCTTPFGEFQLTPFPARRREQLRAWNSADMQLLEEAHRLGHSGKHTLVVNDAHGALAIALGAGTCWTDSWLSSEAIARNAQRNAVSGLTVVWSTSPPPAADLVLLRIPKQLAYLEFQLWQLAQVLAPGSTLLAAGMDKHLSRHTAALIESYIGPTERHRGRHKARLFSARRDPVLAAPDFRPEVRYYCDALQAELLSLPNVFSRDALDGGSRLMIEHLPRLDPVEHAVDLACGNGVLGLAGLGAGLFDCASFCDESALALASARHNARQLFPERVEGLRFCHGDGLRPLSGIAAQLVLLNPPFHREHTVDSFSGLRLVAQAADFLRPGARLLLVANRHLDYGQALAKGFSRCEQLAADRRFNLFLATR